MAKTLPSLPSALIRLAIDDLEKTEKDSRYTIDMQAWHRPYGFDTIHCDVCLAGAVMAQSLEADIESRITPSEFDTGVWGDTAGKLRALDRFRVGDVDMALHYLGAKAISRRVAHDVIVKYDRMPKAFYAVRPEAFKSYMRGMADDLEKVGL